MNFWATLLLLIFLAFVLVITYACCVIGSDSDKQREKEELLREFNRED